MINFAIIMLSVAVIIQSATVVRLFKRVGDLKSRMDALTDGTENAAMWRQLLWTVENSPWPDPFVRKEAE